VGKFYGRVGRESEGVRSNKRDRSKEGRKRVSGGKSEGADRSIMPFLRSSLTQELVFFHRGGGHVNVLSPHMREGIQRGAEMFGKASHGRGWALESMEGEPTRD
jgi:hypothetical protein